jgi:hypothetical protein
MRNLAIALIGVSALAFLLAKFSTFEGFFGDNPILNITAEAFSRASNNLALIAIGIAIIFRMDTSRP